MRIHIAEVGEIEPGGRKLLTIEGKSIGVFNINGRHAAVLNVCPHELAPVCLGRLRGTTVSSAPGSFVWRQDGEILCCPWHGWEFEVLSGRCLTDARRLRTFVVVEDSSGIWLEL